MTNNMNPIANGDTTTNANTERYIQLTNLHLILPNGELSNLTCLYIDTSTGLICLPPSPPSPSSPSSSSSSSALPPSPSDENTRLIDLNGKWVSPGMIDIQINGAFGVDLSEFTNEQEYIEDFKSMSMELCRIGITGFLPTIIKPETYKSILPILHQLPHLLSSYSGVQGFSMTLGWHLEGPFLHPLKNGCHPPSNLVNAFGGIQSLFQVYGKDNVILPKEIDFVGEDDGFVRMITLAPDVEGILDVISQLVEEGWKVSLGHTNASTEQALQGITNGARFLTHLFNAMPSLHHREPGIIGLLGLPEHSAARPMIEASLSQRVVSSAPTPMTRSKAPTRVPSPVLELDLELEEDYEETGQNSHNHNEDQRQRLGPDAANTKANLDDDLAQHLKKPNNRAKTCDCGCYVRGRPAGQLTSGDSGQESTDELNHGSSTASFVKDDVTKGDIKRPYFSIIADGIHVHPQAVSMAYNAHPEGCLLITDAMHMFDPALPDGLHQWRENLIEKKDGGITLNGTDTLAGSILTLSEAVVNLSKFAGISLPQSVVCATYTPAKALGGEVEKKVGLGEGCWADLCIWDTNGNGLKGVWKGGREIWYEA